MAPKKEPSALSRKIQQVRESILGKGLVKFLVRVFQEFSNDDGSTLAAGIAYYIFLSIFPLLLALIGALGLILSSPSVQNQIFNYLSQTIPSDTLQSNIQSVMSLSGPLGITGVIVFLWTGSGAFSALAHGINRAWDINIEMQFILQKIRDVFLTLGIGVLFFLSIIASAGAGAVISNSVPVQNIPLVGSLFAQIVLRVVAFLFSFAIFLILFKIIPNTKTYWRHIWFGALVTAILFDIGQILTFYYLTNFGNYQKVYGPIASIIVLLVWIYYSTLIVILGAEFTSEYGRMRRGMGRGFPTHSIVRPESA